jgi:hypothetical protein
MNFYIEKYHENDKVDKISRYICLQGSPQNLLVIFLIFLKFSRNFRSSNTFLELTRIQKWSKKSEVDDGPNPAREPATKWLCGLPGPAVGLFSSTVSRPILSEDAAKAAASAAARPSRRRRW